ncbi:MAG: DUF2085 domain-containing protein [Chloroflexi bacterium]|nr:DUF2085 domain-containing protein [Chloroflexota bacterium]
MRALHFGHVRALLATPWHSTFIGLALGIGAGLLLWPGIALEWKLYAAVHGVCGQVHNVELGGFQLPLCARNTGIYGSVGLTVLYLWLAGRSRATALPHIGLLLTLVGLGAAMAFDGFNSLLRDLGLPHAYQPWNPLRTLTGIGAGVGLGAVMVWIFNQTLRADPDETQPVMRWRDLAVTLGLGLLMVAMMYRDVAIGFWPIAIIAWSGLVGVLFSIMTIMTGLALGYERRISRLAQLARPATIALVMTGVLLAAMAALRFAIDPADAALQ